MKHLFIINPVAGGKHSRFYETERKVRAFVKTLKDPSEVYITGAPMDASGKVGREAECMPPDDKLYVYACGGDGTLSECVNGAAGRKNVAVTHYPCGTGNDFIKMFGGEDVLRFRELSALAGGFVKPVDLIECNGRYGINICSVGIDARIGKDVHRYSGIPLVGGATGYVVSLIINLIKGVKRRMKIRAGGETFEGDFTLVCACNGRYYGGGFNPVPDAMPDDGIIDFLIIDGVSRVKVIQVVGKYAKGRFRELGDIVTHIRGDYVEIEGEGEFAVNIDGEVLYAEKLYFKVIPGGVNFLFPSETRFFDLETYRS